MNSIKFGLLQDSAKEVGIEIIGAVNRSDAKLKNIVAKASKRLITWQNCGYSGEMRYMKRSPDLLAHPENLLKNWSSIISVLCSYKQPLNSVKNLHFRKALEKGETPLGYGKIARYAWGADYHTVLSDKLKLFAESLLSKCNNRFEFRVFSDSVPLLERTFATTAGIGFIGKNTMVITPKIGSYYFLGELILSASIQNSTLNVIKDVAEGCGSCQRCITNCPTQSFPEAGILDARKCISYLTIEKRTPFTVAEATNIGSWLFGCDICQDVCPFNHSNTPLSNNTEFFPNNGIGPFIKLNEVLSLKSEGETKDFFNGTALSRQKRKGIIRNAAAVAANTKSLECIELLEKLGVSDPSIVVKHSANRALARLLKS
jgi:epoxyqueuosine reductase